MYQLHRIVVVRGWSRRACPGSAPRPKLLGLYALPPVTAARVGPRPEDLLRTCRGFEGHPHAFAHATEMNQADQAPSRGSDALDDSGVLFHRRGCSSYRSGAFPADRAGFRPDAARRRAGDRPLRDRRQCRAPDEAVAPACWRPAAIYAICVFLPNIKHAVESINVPPLPDSWWFHEPYASIMQPVLVWWALFCAEVIDWPYGKHPTPRITLAGRKALTE